MTEQTLSPETGTQEAKALVALTLWQTGRLTWTELVETLESLGLSPERKSALAREAWEMSR